jgi:hypothetical protein
MVLVFIREKVKQVEKPHFLSGIGAENNPGEITGFS